MAASVRVPLGDITNILKDIAIGPIGVGGETAINAAGGVSNTVSDAGNVADFITRLSNKNTWIRIGEFAVGAILLYVGLKAAFPSTVTAVTSVPKTAAKVGGAAALA
jgi:hypothetical protein